MEQGILVINAGSSSLKFAVFVDGSDRIEPELYVNGQMEGLGSDPKFEAKNANGERIDERDDWPRGSTLSHAGALRFILDWLSDHARQVQIVAAGHRVVHGGLAYDKPVRIDAEVLTELETLSPLAPLHQPHNLAAIRAITEINPQWPQVACFDTAFHRSQPKVAQLFALPRALIDSGVRRYGFHGLSYEYIARRLPDYAPDVSKVVVAHLGSGASMCAIRNGRSIESTMGFTAVDGLPMGTRTGALDPGVLLYLLQTRSYDTRAIETLLYKASGWLGVSGISSDMRDLLESNDAHAAEAVELLVYHVSKHLGALASALEGIDALVFTAGIGENAAPIRERVCHRSQWLGIRIDKNANLQGRVCISTPDSPVSVWVIPTNEELMIALHVGRVLRSWRVGVIH
ncbi:MAG: acetate kinase [Candidatus Contendobacter odensis]|uniref:Acetate kinase n=1 Tax=Candidatus Contendibacter odensensis TaxID=1400860 RepID=A0A2G6PG36_9GAMM|nr:MAG: acetate kinase [Candidatus Contendobacter odensis]